VTPSSPSPDELIQRFLEPVAGLGVPRPRYDGFSIANLPVSVLRAVGGQITGIPELSPPLSPEIDPFQGRSAPGPVVVVLLDGFGWFPFVRWGHGSSVPAASRWLEHASPITTVFPTTTSCALTSLSTGAAPSVHGLVGYRQYLPRYGVVADMLKMSIVGSTGRDELVGPHWTPSLVSGCPSIFRRGMGATALSRDRFAGQGFTRILYDGATFVGYSTLTDLGHELTRILTQPAPPPVTYVYWDELDTIQHLKGPRPELIDLELDQFARVLTFVRVQLPLDLAVRTTVLITGDHGQVPSSREASVALDLDPTIVPHLARPLAGDRRSGFLVARPGHLDALKEALNARLPPGSRIIPMEAAVSGGLFGPPPYHPELNERLGDLLVLVPSPAGLTYLPPGAALPSRYLLGAHGGLEPDELIVPLVAGSLSDIV
jgi:hypothetical protein